MKTLISQLNESYLGSSKTTCHTPEDQLRPSFPQREKDKMMMMMKS